MITKELGSVFEKQIEDLPEQCRKVFVMVWYEGLTYKEVAEKLGISVGACGAHINRAMNKIKVSLVNMGFMVIN